MRRQLNRFGLEILNKFFFESAEALGNEIVYLLLKVVKLNGHEKYNWHERAMSTKQGAECYLNSHMGVVHVSHETVMSTHWTYI